MKNILEYLERTAEKYPGRTAVEDDKEALTWKELADLPGGSELPQGKGSPLEIR